MDISSGYACLSLLLGELSFGSSNKEVKSVLRASGQFGLAKMARDVAGRVEGEDSIEAKSLLGFHAPEETGKLKAIPG